MTKFPPPKINIPAPPSKAEIKDEMTEFVRVAVANSRDLAFEAAIDLCTDLAQMGASAADCVITLSVLRDRLNHTDPSSRKDLAQ